MKLWTGRAGSGKTTAMLQHIAQSIRKGEGKFILIVPELASHNMERALAAATGNRGSASAEVLTFRRIANRVFSEAGGLAEQSLTPAGRLMVLYEAVNRTGDRLRTYQNANRKPEVLKDLLGVMDELKCASVLPEDLTTAAQDAQGSLSDKLNDLACISSVYQSMTEEELPDPRDQMTRVLERLPETTLFDGASVFVDSFDNFNRQELDILTWLMAHKVDLTVLLTYDANEPDELPESKAAVKKLEMAARRAEQTVQIRDFGVCKLDKPSDLEHLEQYGLSAGSFRFVSDGQSVFLHSAGDVYSECEYAAAYIRKTIRQTGAKRRDFVVTSREFERYAPMLEQIFARYDLPVFLSEQHDILQKPVLALVTGALRTLQNGWRYEDVFAYLKTGFASVDADECDILENYVDFRRIRGTMWQREWLGNPLRFSGMMSEQETALLAQLNSMRERVIAPLNALDDGLRDAATAADYVRALYDFLEQIGAPERIEQRAQAHEEAGRLQSAEEYRQLWDILVEAMEQFVWVRGDAVMDTDTFVSLFKMVLSEYDVGTIPISMDRIACGPIDRVCHTGIPHLIVLGVNDGVLPSAGTSGGILTDSERSELLGLEIELETGEDRLARENNAMYRIYASACRTLLLSWCTVGADGAMRPSYVIGTVRRLLDGVPETSEAQLDGSYRLEAEKPRLELACRGLGGDPSPAAQAARRALEHQLPHRENGVHPRGPLTKRETVQGLYGERIRLTASRIESFSRCKFAYFLRYGLKAKERRRADFDAPESGTFLHYVLEHVLKDAAGRDGSWQGVSPERVRQSADDWTKRYVDTFLGGMNDHSDRFRYLFRRLTKTLDRILQNLLDELACSDFRPLDFELNISEHGELPSIVMEDEYGQLELVGKVDRVDGYIKDHTLYIRTMDYKSGTKTFELSDLWYGLNMQLLIYLFAIRDEGQRHYTRRLAMQIDRILPAGALYVPAKESVVSAPRNTEDDELDAMREKLLRRSGLLLDDPEVLEAMEHGFGGDGRFLPVGMKKDGAWKASSISSLASMEQMGRLYKHIQKTLRDMGHELLDGNIEAVPVMRGKQDTACQWCPYQQVCQRDETLGDTVRKVYKKKTAEVWNDIVTETEGM